jgi:hypothetical protein
LHLTSRVAGDLLRVNICSGARVLFDIVDTFD